MYLALNSSEHTEASLGFIVVASSIPTAAGGLFGGLSSFSGFYRPIQKDMHLIRERFDDLRTRYENTGTDREKELLERSYENMKGLAKDLLKEFEYWAASGGAGEMPKIDVCGELPYLANRCSHSL